MIKMVFGSILLLAAVALAKSPSGNPSLERIQLEDAQRNLESAISQIRKANEDKKSDCRKALGSSKFCDCLFDKMPSRLQFMDYVQIVTASSAELDSLKKNKEFRDFVVGAISSRDACVGKY